MDELNDIFTIPSDPMRIRKLWHFKGAEGDLVHLESFDNLDTSHQPVARTIKRSLCLNVSKPLGKSAEASDAAREDVLGSEIRH